MRALGTLIFAALASAGTTAHASVASDFFPICSKPPTQAARTLTVDPSGRGAYPNISAALKAAKPGDSVDLMTGDYGDLAITGMNQDGFITIEAATGQTPRFTRIYIGGNQSASHWRLLGLTVSGFSTGLYANGSTIHRPLISISNSDNIIVERNVIQSQAGEYAWRPEVPHIALPDAVSSGIGADQSSCISIVDNKLSNLWDGLSIGGDQSGNHGKYFLISENEIDNFAGDGIDHSVSHLRIERNRITNGHDICNDQCIHTDGIQGWNWHNRPGLVNTDVIIDGNQIIAQTRPGVILPADDLHGITIFDGAWDGMQIYNNLVITDTWHGITVSKANNLSIINNTVAATNPKRLSWLAYATDKNEPPGTQYKVVIRNNIAGDIAVNRNDQQRDGVTIDHNLKVRNVDDFSDIFVKFDPEHFAFDPHLAKRSDAKGEGSPEGAPATDIEGAPRGAKVDLGAYAFKPS